MHENSSALVVGAVAALVGSASYLPLNRWLVRPRIRGMLRRLPRVRADVNPSDPQLTYRACVTVSAEGLERRTSLGAMFVHWDALKRWEEAGGYIMALGDAMVGFCLSTSRVDHGTLD